MDIPSLLRLARRERGLTQRELAERIGTTQSAISRWEGGGATPSIETLQRLLEACGFEAALELRRTVPVLSAQIEGNLTLSPAQRLDQLVRTVRFIEAGRRAMAGGSGRDVVDG